MAQQGEYPKSNGDIYYGQDANMAYYQASLANSALNYGSVYVGSPASQIAASNTSRKNLLIRNNSGSFVYVGSDSSVDDSTGVKIKIDKCIAFTGNGATDAVYGYAPSGNLDVRYLEIE